MQAERIEIPCVIGGKDVRTGTTFESVMPHRKEHVLADVHQGGAEEVQAAITAAAKAWPEWSRTPWEERVAIFLRASELLAGPWRQTLNAATMLNQSKTVHQAEIDAACELIDFWRFNADYLVRIYEEQPASSPGVWNRMEYRPLEGFVFAVSPFNFTAIGGNLTSSPAMMGNTVVWKPASTAAYSAYFLMRLLQEAGLPDGVINLVYGPGRGDRRPGAREPGPRRHPLHRLDVGVSRHVADGRRQHRALPQLPAHRRRDRRQGLHRRPSLRRRRRGGDRRAPRLLRVPGPEVLGRLAYLHRRVVVGARRATASPTRWGRSAWATSRTSGTSWGPSSTRNAFRQHREAIEEAKAAGRKIVAGGATDDCEGFFVEPTVIETSDPDDRLLRDELFGPIVTAFVYPDSKWQDTLRLVDETSPYALTGAVFARDRGALEEAERGSSLRRRELLRQRQADRRGRRPAAFRRREGVGHERQGRLDVEPHPLGQPAHDQGDVRPRYRLPLPLPRA